MAQPGGVAIGGGPAVLRVPFRWLWASFLGHLPDSGHSFRVTGSLHPVTCSCRPQPAVMASVLTCAPRDVPLGPGGPVVENAPTPAQHLVFGSLLCRPSSLLADGACGASSPSFPLDIPVLSPGAAPPGDLWPCLEIAVVVTVGVPCLWHHVWRLEVLLNLLKCTEQPPTESDWAPVSTAPRLRVQSRFCRSVLGA